MEDNFIKYMKKHRPELFFFIDEFAIVRYYKKCALLNKNTGEVLSDINVGTVRETAYSKKHNKIFLKSVLNGYLYAYDLVQNELKKLFKVGHTNSIFVSRSGEFLIAYTSYGPIRIISANTYEIKAVNDCDTRYFYYKGWDNPYKKRYEFIGVGSLYDIPCSMIAIDYEGNTLFREVIKIDGDEIRHNDAGYNSETDTYILDYRKKSDKADGLPLTVGLYSDDVFENSLGNIIEGNYKGGCHYMTFFRNYAFLCHGDKNIYVIDLKRREVIKRFVTDDNTTTAQYDYRRNMLFASSGLGKIYLFEDVLE